MTFNYPEKRLASSDLACSNFFIKNDIIKPHVFPSAHIFYFPDIHFRRLHVCHQMFLNSADRLWDTKPRPVSFFHFSRQPFLPQTACAHKPLAETSSLNNPEVTSKTFESIQQNLGRRLKVEIWPRNLQFCNSFIKISFISGSAFCVECTFEQLQEMSAVFYNKVAR